MDSWSHLSIYESTDLVRGVFKSRHNRELNTQKAKEIVSVIAQGREYFSAASESGPLVRPLLQYYGVLSLSRGLILLLSPNLRETSLPQAHGLSTNGWNDLLSTSINKPTDLKIKITNGTFLSLLNETKNSYTSIIFQAPYPNKLVMTRYSSASTFEGATFSFQEVLSRIPELRHTYEKSFGENSNCYRSFVFNLSMTTHTDIDVFPGIQGLPSEQEIRSSLRLANYSDFRLTEHHNFMPQEPHYSFRIPHTHDTNFYQVLPCIDNGPDGNTSIIVPFPLGASISPLGRFFLLSYYLGTLARYHPTFWLSMMQGQQKGDYLLPLIRESMSVIQDRFPSLVIQQLEL